MICDYIAGKILTGIFMLVCAALDFRESKIDIRVFAAMLFAELCGYVGMWLYGCEIDFASVATGFGIGIAICAISLISKGSIGIGDGLFFSLTGMAMGGVLNFLLFAAGIAVSAFAGLFIAVLGMAGGRRKRIGNLSFAFLPLVFPAGLLILIFA